MSESRKGAKSISHGRRGVGHLHSQTSSRRYSDQNVVTSEPAGRERRRGEVAGRRRRREERAASESGSDGIVEGAKSNSHEVPEKRAVACDSTGRNVVGQGEVEQRLRSRRRRTQGRRLPPQPASSSRCFRSNCCNFRFDRKGESSSRAKSSSNERAKRESECD
ncbi:hypothetical protein M5K25_016342 [Dendrobium thyrsiflorum]|uniref:Uncharacterized protein n=1 Tax=Dendrobium thyrsiflorum TaxID=117978 RepID=A0ABD0URD2_DENTH